MVVEPDTSGKPAYATSIAYDGAGKVASIKQQGGDDDAARRRTFVYDLQDRVVSATSPEAGTTSYTYDSYGNLATKTDPRGHTITYIWDESKRLLSKRYSDGTPAHIFSYRTGTQSQSSYLESSSAHIAERIYHYDAKGNLDSLVLNTPNSSNVGYTVGFIHDDSGRVTGVTYPDGRVVSQIWTKTGLLDSISDGSTVFFSHPSYLAFSGHLKEATLGNGVVVHHSFDQSDRLRRLTLFNKNKPLLDESFEYTRTGSLTSLIDNLHSENSYAYKYDQLGRVQSAQGATSQQFQYDPFGNRAIRENEGVSATFDAHNRFTGGEGFTYDDDGDMTFDGVHRYSYDGDGLIVSVDDGAFLYYYDAEGNRVQKKLADGFHDYVWVNGHLLAEKLPNGTWTDYIYAGNTRIANVQQKPAKEGRTPTAEVIYTINAPLGVTRTSLGQSGAVVASGIFNPFGDLAKGAPEAGSISFSDEVHDAETGLDSYQFRSYNPRLGRWMSADPSSLRFSRLDNPQTLNFMHMLPTIL